MRSRIRFVHRLTGAVMLLVLLSGGLMVAAAAPLPVSNYIVLYDPSVQVNSAQVQAQGNTLAADLSEAGVLIVRSNNPDALRQLPGVTAVIRDRVRFHVPDQQVTQVTTFAASSAAHCASTHASCPLQWDLDRIHVPKAWETTRGSRDIKVAVIDTGLSSTHEEVGANYDIAESKSFVEPGAGCDADETTFSSIEDFNGHGTWTNTHVAGVNGPQMTGIAPKTTLVNLRVIGACGFGLDSWVMQAMIYGGRIGARVESMSIGGYSCADGVVPGSTYCGTPEAAAGGPETWRAYRQIVNHLLAHGTVVVAAAGNEHVRLSANGRVQTVGSLAFNSPTNDPLNDLSGLRELPAGMPGVVAVAAVNRRTATGARSETLFGQYGRGRRDQLTYYSSFGERIDVSAPGGARNYNVPRFDCVSANCARLDPSAPGATDNPGDFGAWAFDAAGNPCDDCYVNIQGTSMATPQVAGVAALALAVHPNISAKDLIKLLRHSVTDFKDANATPAIASNPASPWYNYDVNYNGQRIPNSLMGTGVIDAARAVR